MHFRVCDSSFFLLCSLLSLIVVHYARDCSCTCTCPSPLFNCLSTSVGRASTQYAILLWVGAQLISFCVIRWLSSEYINACMHACIYVAAPGQDSMSPSHTCICCKTLIVCIHTWWKLLGNGMYKKTYYEICISPHMPSYSIYKP